MSHGGRLLPLCPLDTLADLGCREFRYGDADEILEGFVVRRGDQVYGYRNACPHLDVTLNWLPHSLLDPRKSHIQCALHGALFVIETGECVAGPCMGRYLEKIAVEIDGDGRILVPELMDGPEFTRWNEKPPGVE